MSTRAAARGRLGGARRHLRLARYPVRRAVIPYVGWTGEGNLGDEAMFLAHRALLPQLDFGALPAHPDARVMRGLARVPWLACPAICLGGGTLVGNGHFRRALEVVMDAWPQAPRFTLGVGVEDPGYRIGRREDVRAELGRWATVLRRFIHVGVRGPRSRDVLRELGVEAGLVGDPALALACPAVPMQAGLLGLNVGLVDDQWGLDAAGFRRGVVSFARRALADGWRVRLISTWRPDAALQAGLAAELGAGASAAPATLGVHDTIAELARCELVVGHKLHACVLAAVGGVPSIALEYRPKCRDFQESVGRGEFVMRTDRLDTGVLLEWLRVASANRADQAATLRGRVVELQGTLRAAAHDIGTGVTGPHTRAGWTA